MNQPGYNKRPSDTRVAVAKEACEQIVSTCGTLRRAAHGLGVSKSCLCNDIHKYGPEEFPEQYDRLLGYWKTKRCRKEVT